MVRDTVKRSILTVALGLSLWHVMRAIGVMRVSAAVVLLTLLLLSHYWAGRCALAIIASFEAREYRGRDYFDRLLPLAATASHFESVPIPELFVGQRGKRAVFAAGGNRSNAIICVHRNLLEADIPNSQITAMMRTELRHVRKRLPLKGTLICVVLIAAWVAVWW